MGQNYIINMVCFLAQCISLIQRYLKGIYNFVNHKSLKTLSDFLLNITIKEMNI